MENMNSQKSIAMIRRPTSNASRASRMTTATGSNTFSPPTLSCNLCQKPLATTCYLCSCDCIFCESCTYSHFEQTSQCPVCNKTLSENDFTELVVAEATSATSDITKTSLQALFSKHSKTSSPSEKGLQFSDLCYSLIRQIDVTKQSTKFLLKQLLMDNSGLGRKHANVARLNGQLKYEITNIKQSHSAQRIQLEQANNNLKNLLLARENTIKELNEKMKEKDKIIDQFRQLHGKMTSKSRHPLSGTRDQIVGDLSTNLHTIPLSGPRIHGSERLNEIETRKSTSNPPLKGFMMQKQAQHHAEQRSYAPRRAPNMSLSIPNSHVTRQSQSYVIGDGDSIRQQHLTGHPVSQNTQPPLIMRPYSSNSSGSVCSNAPRIRDLTSSSGYSFTGSGNQRRLNKRRRDEGTPASNCGPMSPSTAFTLNHGPYSSGSSNRWNHGRINR